VLDTGDNKVSPAMEEKSSQTVREKIDKKYIFDFINGNMGPRSETKYMAGGWVRFGDIEKIISESSDLERLSEYCKKHFKKNDGACKSCGIRDHCASLSLLTPKKWPVKEILSAIKEK
jgi:hypothetical protein